jgi:nucleotide-binding universal stress UspA family protein
MNGSQTNPTVLVGVDGSDDALRAVRWAAREAARRQLPLRLVHAFPWVAEPDFDTLARGEHSPDRRRARRRAG